MKRILLKLSGEALSNGTGELYDNNFVDEVAAVLKTCRDEGYQLAKEVLSARIEKLKFIADFLVKHETMDDEQFNLAMQDEVTMEDVENLVTAKKRRSQEENKKKADSENEKKRLAYEERKRLERELGLPDDEDPVEASVVGTKRDRKDDGASTVIYMPPASEEGEPKADEGKKTETEPKDDTAGENDEKPE